MRKYLAIAVTSLLLFNACEQNEAPLEELTDNTLSVENMKHYFDTEIKPFQKGRDDGNMEIDWEEGDQRDVSFGEALVFPVNLENPATVGLSEDVKMDVQSNTSVFSYVHEGEYHLELVQQIPTEATEEFTGYLVAMDWNGTPLRYYEFDNGEHLGVWDARASEDGGRVECTEYTYSWCDERPGPDDCYEVSSWTVCKITNDGFFPSLDDMDGGGGLRVRRCPHPYRPGVMVPCGGYYCDGGTCCDAQGYLDVDCHDDLPCSGNPLKHMEITPPASGDVNGGRYGCTRSQWDKTCGGVVGRKLHDGIDITSAPGTHVFAVFGGVVTSIRTTFAPNQYHETSYGNFVEIKSNDPWSGEIKLKYNHLREVHVRQGQEISAGTVIGKSGRTGNAADDDVIPHLHIQATNKVSGVWQRADPEDFLEATWDSNGNLQTSPCQY